MNKYLILRLAGPMQFWGQPTFEGTRPAAPLPTRSGLLGLLGACLGIRRGEQDALQQLSESVRFAVHCGHKVVEGKPLKPVKITDYHTVLDAREDYASMKSHQTIQTWREYLCDSTFSVAVWCLPATYFSVDKLCEAVRKPRFTPYLGRRSCPMTEPLFVTSCQAENPVTALLQGGSNEGIIYSEEALSKEDRRYSVRDEPIITLPRQFASREWFFIQGGNHVSE